MVVLYSYPQLFGLPDNNSFGLKVDTFLRLAQIPYQQKHILDSHLYWVMSYSCWQDERFWPLFKDEFLKQSFDISESVLEQAKK